MTFKENRGHYQKKFLWLIVIAAFVLMFFHFFSNAYFGIFGLFSSKFSSWALDPEALVLRKIELAKTEGIFVNAGLLMMKGTAAYINQIGLHGMVFSIIEKIVSFFTLNTIPVLNAITVITFEIVFFLLLFWLKDEFGFWCSAITYICTLGSYWLLVTTRNLFAVTWTMLLPFVAVLLLLKREEKLGKKYRNLMFGVVFVTIFIRLACGFEFASSTMIAMELPFIYYAIKNRWTFTYYLVRSLGAGIAAIVSFITAIAINLWQRAVYLGSFNLAISNLDYNIGKRTGLFLMDSTKADFLIHGEANKASLEANVFKVIYSYLDEEYIVAGFNALEVILIIMIFAALCLIAKKYSDSIASNWRKLLSLAAMTGLSVLAPISWFVLAKGHSAIHTNWNYILWSMPFSIIGTAYCGAVLMYIIQDYVKRRRTLRKLTT